MLTEKDRYTNPTYHYDLDITQDAQPVGKEKNSGTGMDF